MEKAKKRIIQVGLGPMGQAWADCIARSDDWEAAAYVDPDAHRLTEMSQRHGMPRSRCFSDIGAVLKHVHADAVLDATPQLARRAVCLAAMAAGLDVLCEKPLADTLDNAVLLSRRAQETGRILMVAQNYRCQTPVQAVRRFLARDGLGRIGYAGVCFHKGPHFGGYREQMSHPLLLDMSIHHFDMLRCMLQSDIRSVQGISVNAPWNWNRGDATVMLHLEMSDDVAVNYFASWVSQGYETGWNGHWRIEGEKGALFLDDTGVFVANRPQHRRRLPLPKMPTTHQARLLQLFGSAVSGRLEPESSARNNLNSLAATHAAVCAVRERRRVTVSEMLDNS